MVTVKISSLMIWAPRFPPQLLPGRRQTPPPKPRHSPLVNSSTLLTLRKSHPSRMQWTKREKSTTRSIFQLLSTSKSGRTSESGTKIQADRPLMRNFPLVAALSVPYPLGPVSTRVIGCSTLPQNQWQNRGEKGRMTITIPSTRRARCWGTWKMSWLWARMSFTAS